MSKFILVIILWWFQWADMGTTYIGMQLDGVYEGNSLLEPYMYEPWFLLLKLIVMPLLVALLVWRVKQAVYAVGAVVLLYMYVILSNLFVILESV